MRAFRVYLPSGMHYWTVLDDELRLFEPADRFLRELRLAQGRAESTTKAYAHALVLFLVWCATTGRDWRTAVQDMGLLVLWLRWTPGRGGQHRVVVPGPGSKPVREDRRINKVLTAIRMFLIHAVNNKEVRLVPVRFLTDAAGRGVRNVLPGAHAPGAGAPALLP
ncbi:hypothetical protein AB0A98_22455 [Streptomyces chrestomyceticus]|uniref:hypothetical protein n=1 Tax=Streptomyces chrestomyceticus TaxID=68185 RepID=UPI0033F7594B